MPDVVRNKYTHQLNDDKPQDLTAELANLRGLANVWYEKIRTTVSPEGVVQMTDKDVVMMMELMERTRRMAETQAKINPEQFVPISDIAKVIGDMIEIIRSNINGQTIENPSQLRERITADIRKYCLEELASRIVNVEEKPHNAALE